MELSIYFIVCIILCTTLVHFVLMPKWCSFEIVESLRRLDVRIYIGGRSKVSEITLDKCVSDAWLPDSGLLDSS